jgi:hypothetical protein
MSNEWKMKFVEMLAGSTLGRSRMDDAITLKEQHLSRPGHFTSPPDRCKRGSSGRMSSAGGEHFLTKLVLLPQAPHLKHHGERATDAPLVQQ